MDESSAAKDAQAGATTRPAPSMIAERYRVLRVLGEGSSGTVYLCEHTALEKEVAVKVLHRELADNAGLVARFTREAQTAARLDHPSSVHVMDFGQDRDGTLYLVMEYVEGRDLAQLLDDEPALDDERIVHIMSCILSALSAAHALGIVHRDLKPENVLIRPDPSVPGQEIVKVCDFGVAQFSPVRMAHNNNHKRVSAARRVTDEGVLVGTPWYMSPEQARAEALDARSDIYSAGIVLFQLLTRTLPFMGDDVMAVALMHCTTPPPPPSGFGAVHPGLEAVCLRALSKTREARYQSANDMLLELRAAISTKLESRSLARISKVPSVALTVSPLTAAYPTLSGTSTPMGTPSVKHLPPPSRYKQMPSLLLAGVAATVLGIVMLPRVLPPDSRVVAMWKLFGAQPSAAKGPELRRPQLPTSAAPAAPTVAPATAVEPERAWLDAPLPSDTPLAGKSEALAQAAPVPPPAAAPRPRKARAARAAAPKAAEKAIPAEAETADEDVTLVPSSAAEEAIAAPAAPVEVDALAPPKPQPTAAAATVPPTAAPVEPPPAAAAVSVKTAPEKLTPHATTKIARVEISADHLPPGTSRASLRSALSHTSLVNCYAQAQQRTPQAELPATALDLKTNTSGRIVWAHVANTALPAPLRECLEQVARSGHVRTGEGGEVQATINLSPSP